MNHFVYNGTFWLMVAAAQGLLMLARVGNRLTQNCVAGARSCNAVAAWSLKGLRR